MRLPVRVHDLGDPAAPRAGAGLRRILVPARPLRHAHLTHLLWYHTGALIASRADLLRLGALFRLAAVSPHSAVYLPLRGNPPSPSAEAWRDAQGLADLVVARREAALRPSAWPDLRARLRRGRGVRPAGPTAPPPREAPPTGEHLSAAEHGATVFFRGTAAALFDAGDELTRCGDEVARHRDVRRFGGPALLSQFDGPGLAPGRRDESWECMILAEDPLFQRRPVGPALEPA
ncbi:hypothetical protein [Dactylosporangium darangshiense]|uniref:Uncharacterized protein n=1 Tax=Dactylosporangium darangshiense TaxID=579108 RepID=A0ABP8DKJ0_9ACTN